jgi:thymidylate synthase ThyX
VAYSARVVCDSIAPHGVRLVTVEATYPRFVHSELLTHRVFSRNSSSSRAIPIEKMIQRVIDDPVMPVSWGRNQRGMQAGAELSGDELAAAQAAWLRGREAAVEIARTLAAAGLHKQVVNRVLEPWMWITVLITATDWDNFYALRCHPDAQPELRHAAEMMRDAMAASTPRRIAYGEWHVPYARDEDATVAATALDNVWSDDITPQTYARLLLSVARCARVSYDASASVREQAEDIVLAKRLASSGHWSPFEHIATPTHRLGYSANFWGWCQLRRLHRGEAGLV